jgi:hypothetical protein
MAEDPSTADLPTTTCSPAGHSSRHRGMVGVPCAMCGDREVCVCGVQGVGVVWQSMVWQACAGQLLWQASCLQVDVLYLCVKACSTAAAAAALVAHLSSRPQGTHTPTLLTPDPASCTPGLMHGSPSCCAAST